MSSTRLDTTVAPLHLASTQALNVRDLSVSFGAFRAVEGVSLDLALGERRALIGPNGAGKTTFVNLLTGALTPTSGTVHIGGEDITALAPEARIERGLARTFQVTSLFNTLSVRENVALASSERVGDGWRVLRRSAFGAGALRAADDILALVGLEDDAHRKVSQLPYGRQRLIELAIALALRPKVLLLDEPAAGLPAADHEIVLGAIDALPAELAVLLIDHDMPLVFRFASRVTVLAEGRLVADGTVDEIRRDPEVRKVYLGTSK